MATTIYGKHVHQVKNDQVQHRFTLTKSKRMSTYKTVTTVPGKHEIPIECLRLVFSLNRL